MGLVTIPLFLALVFFAGAAILRLPLKGKWKGLPLYAPLLAALCYALYELTIPVQADIRIDLFLVFPILAISFVGGLVRWVLRLVRYAKEGKAGLEPMAGVCMTFLYLFGFLYACLLVLVGDPYFAALKGFLSLY